MSFKKIEILGFKSFPDKTKIPFDDGVTAIVGPNGCGKSNISDAIRWVLGEQRSSMLRGSSMQDVIFSGTEKRSRLSFCQVKLFFDNSSNIFDTEYDEVLISRKLYRSGESEYYINNNSVRLKDIKNLLYNSGIGKDGYSIIGQGQVERILNSKPQERRAIFEDAAGISGFKAKKDESERRLSRTNEKLSRIKDIIVEIKRQLDPLKDQAGKAKKFIELKEDLKTAEINNYLYKYDSVSQGKISINAKIKSMEEEVGLKQEELKAVSLKLKDNDKKLDTLDSTIQENNSNLLNITVSKEKVSGDINVLTEKINSKAMRLKELENSNKKLMEKKENTETSRLKNQEQLAQFETQSEKLNTELENLDEEINAVLETINKKEEEFSGSQKQMMDSISEIGEIKSQISKLDTEKDITKKKVDDIGLEIENKSKELEEVSSQDKQESERIKNLNSKIKSVNTDFDSIEKNLDSKNKNIEDIKSEIYEKQNALSSYESRYNTLKDMQSSYEGYLNSVKKILRDKKNDQNLSSKMVGVLAELIDVPSKFKQAIEMTLGSAIQNIVTKNEEDAKEIIDYIKKREYGRATFLPISSVKSRQMPYEYDIVSNSKGVIGIASELIDFDDSIRNVVQSLMGATLIVETLEDAISIARKANYSFKIVTLTGDILMPHGSITGGSTGKNISRILGRDDEIKRLLEEIKNIKQEIPQLENNEANIANEINDLTQDYKEADSNLRNMELELSQSKEKNVQQKRYMERLKNEIKDSEGLEKELSSRIDDINKELFNIDKISGKLPSSDKQKLDRQKKEFDVIKEKRDSLLEKKTELKLDIASIEGKKDRSEQEISNFDELLLEIEQDIEYNKNSLNNIENEHKDLERTIENTKLHTSGKAEAKIIELEDKIKKAQSKKTKLKDEQEQLDDKKSILAEQLDFVKNNIHSKQIKLSKMDAEIENMESRIQEEYNLDYESASSLKKDKYNLKEGLKNSKSLKSKIDYLGHVNVNAIEDVKALDERYNELYNQEVDLTKAKDDLKKIIKELSKEMTERFATEFEKIQKNFTEVFVELFGGGNAKLVLTDPDETGDLLTCGIDIIAEPPGKKLQNITLLSGGEKALTAIAILFAILKIRPMPFCLLDEIESSLDESNVKRFASYLKNFSRQTQFIVITHRKPTMELADSLFGITMQEKGVSAVVSVKLSEAIKSVKKGGDKSGDS